MYEPRTYRDSIKDADLVSFSVVVDETDLYVRAASDLSAETRAAINDIRAPLEQYIRKHPIFLHSLEPIQVGGDAPDVVRVMAEAAQKAGVGPMAAVAGAVAELVGLRLLRFSPEVIVENGGDIFLKSDRERLVGVYAGSSPFTGKLSLRIKPAPTPAGVCTSSGTVGPSLSLGLADAAIVVSPSAALADAVATAVGNAVKSAEDIAAALERGKNIEGVSGVLVVVGDRMGAWGDVELVRL